MHSEFNPKSDDTKLKSGYHVSFRAQDISIFLRIAATYLAAFACFLIIIYKIHVVQKTQKHDENLVEVSQRNKLLVQKLSYYTNRIYAGEEQFKESTLNIVKVIDGSINAMKVGGVAPEMPYLLQAISGQEIIPVYFNTQLKWTEYKDLIKIVLDEPLYLNAADNNIGEMRSVFDNTISVKSKNQKVSNAIMKINNKTEEVLNLFQELTQCITLDIAKKQEQFSFFLWVVAFVMLFIVILFITQTKRYIIKPLQEIIKISDGIALGNLSEKIQYTGRDELGQISKSINNLSYNQSLVKEFAEEIGKGNLNHSFTSVSEHDSLGNALIQMRNKLQEVSVEQEQRSWANQGHAKFADMLRHNNDDLIKLADEIIQYLVHYMKANQGGFFIYNDTTEKHQLELIACYAYNRKKYADKVIDLKEGLVGTCAIEKQTIFLTEIPDDYLKITSGLGEANPRCIIIVPLKLEDKIYGVIELASFNKMEAYEIQFIEKIAESIASTISSVQINENIKALLVSAQEKTEKLLMGEEEMRQNLEEMHATQDDMAVKEEELRVMNNKLETLHSELAQKDIDQQKEIERINALNAKQVKELEKNNLEMQETINEFQNFCSEESNLKKEMENKYKAEIEIIANELEQEKSKNKLEN